MDQQTAGTPLCQGTSTKRNDPVLVEMEKIISSINSNLNGLEQSGKELDLKILGDRPSSNCESKELSTPPATLTLQRILSDLKKIDGRVAFNAISLCSVNDSL